MSSAGVAAAVPGLLPVAAAGGGVPDGSKIRAKIFLLFQANYNINYF
jgi:hypothetical protein